MTEHSICPDCGADLPTGATAGLCPKCLLAGAMESSDDAPAVSPYAATTPQAGGFVPPAAAVLAPYFPGLEILEILGHGGMGAVYKARQTKLDRIVALKIIRPESADDPAFAERFTREARTLARLSHPNIVAIHDFGEVVVRRGSPTPPTPSTAGLPDVSPGGETFGRPGGSVGDRPQLVDWPQPDGTLFFFVMEYIDGANLRQVMQAGALQPAQALAIVPQICDALQYAHDEGIIHRDIKPENILIDRRGRVKIADFGLAKLAAQSAENFTLTGTHQVMGTPRYMAPEQMEGSHLVDHRADIYSLGVVFYEMLTCELPLGRFDPPSHKSAVDARLDDVVHRALAKEPSHRYQRASEIRRDVDAVVLDALSHGGADSLVGAESMAAGFPGPSTILERQVAGVVNWIRGAPASPEGSHPPSLSTADRATIQRKVRAPGIAMLLYGVLLLIPAVLLFTNGFDIADGNDGMPWGVGVAMIAGSLCVIGLSGLVIRGAWHLLSLEGLRPALLGSMLGQPVGIWPLIVLSRRDVKEAFTARGAMGRHASGVNTQSVAAKPGASPVARYGFTAARHDDLGPHIKFHFGELGYRLVREAAGEWVFERGRKSAAFLETNIRAYHATLTVRSLPLGDAGQRVSCTWVVATLGLAHIGRRDVAALEAEGRELESLLRPSATSVPSSGAQEQHATPITSPTAYEASSGAPTASPQAPFPDLDLRRIEMELKAPAAGLMFVAGLNLLLSVVLGVALAADGWGFARGQFRAEPIEIAAAVAATIAVLLVFAALVHGARHMQRMTSYEWAVAASFLAMLPFWFGVLWGLPLGIWAFRTLRRPEVRDAFLKRALEREAHRRRRSSSGGRDWVTVSREAAEHDELPDVCMVCGASAGERINRTFHHEPDWAGFLLLFGLLPGLAALAFTSRSMRVACPVCLEHRGHWSRQVWVAGLGWLLIPLVGALGYLGGMLAFPEGPALDDKHRIWGMLAGGAAGLVIWLVPLIYLASTRVRAKKITLHDITFEKVAPEFARAAAGLGAAQQTIQGR